MSVMSPRGAGRLLRVVPVLLAPLLLAPAPPLPEHTVLTPEFRVDKEPPRSAGGAFVLDLDGEQRIVTALHLLGPPAGRPTQLATDELAGRVSVDLRGALSGKKVLSTDQLHPLPSAYATEKSGDIFDVAGDITAFTVPRDKKGKPAWKKQPNSLTLAEECPAEGSTIYLASPLLGTPAATHAGTVTLCDGRRLEWTFEFDRNPRGMSGAPVLDERGRVVAMALAAYTTEVQPGGPTRLVAVGMAAPTIAAHLRGETVVRHADLPPPPPRASTGPWDNPWGIDMERLHREMLVEWGVSGSGEPAIRQEMGKNPELLAIFDEVSRLSWADNIGNFRKINALIERWSALYASQGMSLRLRALAVGQQLGFLATRRLFAAEAGGGTVEIHQRLDPLNVRDHPMEWYPGRVGVTYVNVVRSAALEQVLPLLADASSAARATAVRTDVGAALGPETLAILQAVPASVDPLSPDLDAGTREALERLTALVAQAWARGLHAGNLAKEGEAPTAGWVALLTGPLAQTGAVLFCDAAKEALDAKALAKELGGCGSDLSRGAKQRLDALVGGADLAVPGLPDRLPVDLPSARKQRRLAATTA